MVLACCKSESNKNNISVVWDNSIILPSLDGISDNKGVAGAFSGFIGDELIIAGGANFPVGYPWSDGKKKWWDTSYFLPEGEKAGWKIYNGFLPRAIGYGVTVKVGESLLFIGGCDKEKCYPDIISIQKKEDSIIASSVHKYPSLPVPLANMAGAMVDNKIYIAGGQESMIQEKSTNHFFVLDTDNPDTGWSELPSWPGASRGYAVCIAQDGKIYLFSGRSYGPNEETVMHTDGFRYDPAENIWTKLPGHFPVMAATAIPFEDDKILFFGGVGEILPTDPAHPGFSNIVRIYDTNTNILDSLTTCPYPIPVTTQVVMYNKETFYLCSGEIKPGIRSPHIIKGVIKKGD